MAAALPFVAGGAIIGGSVLGARAQGQQLAAEEAAATANAQQAAQNAVIVRRESRRRAEKAIKGGEELKSTQKAVFGKAGVLLTGSAQEILAETERVTAEDVEAILRAGEAGSREALFAASQSRAQAEAARKAKTIAPLATLVSGAGTAAAVAA